MAENHNHVWGPVEQARMTGNPHRKCQVEGCRQITLDLSDEDDTPMSLYESLVAIGAQIDHHESDLYVLMTADTDKLVKASRYPHSFFKSQIDNKMWIDVPFAYSPWWEAKQRHAAS